MTRGPVLIDLEGETSDVTPATAPAVIDDDAPHSAAMQSVAALATRRGSVLGRWFWSLTLMLLGFVISLAAWDYVNALLMRNPVLGLVVTLLLVLLCCVSLAVIVRELAAFWRLRRIDKVQSDAATALADEDLAKARIVTDQINRLYAGRDDTKWGRDRLAAARQDALDADALFGVVEQTLLEPLDARATKEVEAAARQVATVTAIVPLALADVFTALTANLRMIRRIAEIYGGRAGTLGSWRLTRTVLTHLVATGAVAVGDDLIGSVAGGGVLSKVSRRFGEGVVNGALTARVGVAAIEVCRPLPFTTLKRPSVSALVGRALTGLFGRS